MIGRRQLVAGACCLASVGAAHARPAQVPFICATPDVEEAEAPAPPSPFPRVGATLDPENLWTVADGATPNTGRITLDVCFLNGTAAQKALVRSVVPQWTAGKISRRIAFRFDRPARGSHVRLRFGGGKGNISEVGRKNLAVAPERETMNLDDVDQRGILHEFGHVLGLRHEHQHPNSGIVWNKPVVVKALARYGWSAQKVQENIFDHFSKDCACIGDPLPDPHSIMLYAFPAEWTRNGKATTLNRSISQRDRRCLERVYRV